MRCFAADDRLTLLGCFLTLQVFGWLIVEQNNWLNFCYMANVNVCYGDYFVGSLYCVYAWPYLYKEIFVVKRRLILWQLSLCSAVQCNIIWCDTFHFVKLLYAIQFLVKSDFKSSVMQKQLTSFSCGTRNTEDRS